MNRYFALLLLAVFAASLAPMASADVGVTDKCQENLRDARQELRDGKT